MSRRFGPASQLHQRDPRSALFDGYERRSGAGAGANSGGGSYPGSRTHSASPTPGYGYPGTGASGSGGINGGFRPATPNRKGQYSDAVIDELESQNDDQVAGMSARVRMLKDITVAIGDEIRDSSKLADSMNDRFEQTRVRLRGTMTRMLRMAEKTGVGWRVWLGFFAAVGLLFWYVWLF